MNDTCRLLARILSNIVGEKTTRAIAAVSILQHVAARLLGMQRNRTAVSYKVTTLSALFASVVPRRFSPYSRWRVGRRGAVNGARLEAGTTGWSQPPPTQVMREMARVSIRTLSGIPHILANWPRLTVGDKVPRLATLVTNVRGRWPASILSSSLPLSVG